jgi:hypothetical protein
VGKCKVQGFADVFSMQKVDTLLPHWDCDLEINIDKEGSIYLLSKFELKTLWEFIDENLKTVLSILQILRLEHLFFLLRKKMVLSDYVLISNGLMLSLGKTSILYH